MVTEELLDYIRAHRGAGATDPEVRERLSAAGWDSASIEAGMAAASGAPLPPETGSDGLPGFGALVSEAWDTFKKRFGTLLGASILPGLIVFGFIALGAVGVGVAAALGVSFSGAALVGTIVAAAVAVIVIIYLGIWSQAALIAAALGSGEQIGVGEAYRRTRSLVGPFFWVSILTGLVVMSGLLLLGIGAIVFGTWLSFASWTLIDEGHRGTRALQQSYAYVKGRGWGVFWRVFVFSFLGALVSSIISSLTGGNGENPSVLSNVLGLVFYLVWTPLSIAFTYALYRGLKNSRPNLPAPTGPKTWYVVGAVAGLLVPLVIAAVALSFAKT